MTESWKERKEVVVSFIVIAYNAEATIGQCLEAIVGQNQDMEIILVDNNSTDGTAIIGREYGVKVVTEKVKSRGIARNTGLRNAKGTYIAFIDSDVIIPPDWSKNAIGLLKEHRELAGVGGPGISPESKPTCLAMNTLQYGQYIDSNSGHVKSLPTLAVLYRGSSIEDKWFKPLWTGEDAEFNFALIEDGKKLLWDATLKVTHFHLISLMELAKKSLTYGKWYLVPYLFHPKLITAGVVSRVLFIPILAIALFVVVTGAVSVVLVILLLMSPFLAYLFEGVRSKSLNNIGDIAKFVFVHSIRQYSQMLGIWLGILDLTVSKALRLGKKYD